MPILLFFLFANTATARPSATSIACIQVLRDNLLEIEKVSAYLSHDQQSFNELLEAERVVALQYLLDNIVSNGAVAAATSNFAPNYRYYWHRDAALVYAVLWKETKDPKYLKNFLAAETEFLNANMAGEPKSELDFSPYTGPWARPQNDGPALAILSLNPLVQIKDSHAGKAKTMSLRLAEYLVAMREFGRDVEPWEEDHGKHFYNGMAQHMALLKAANLAEKDGDQHSQQLYTEVALEIKKRLDERHWDPEKKRIIPNVDRPEGGFFHDKVEDLDIQILLAYLHTDTSVVDSKLMSSFHQLRNSFIYEFPLNSVKKQFNYAVAMGRYPNDQWDGVTRTGANPWFISTFASAEFFFKLASGVTNEKKIQIDSTNRFFYIDLVSAFKTDLVSKITSEENVELHLGTSEFEAIRQSMLLAGNEFLMLGLSHGARDGRLSEQFSRFNGYMLGAENLTWSYAALLSALQARREL